MRRFSRRTHYGPKWVSFTHSHLSTPIPLLHWMVPVHTAHAIFPPLKAFSPAPLFFPPSTISFLCSKIIWRIAFVRRLQPLHAAGHLHTFSGFHPCHSSKPFVVKVSRNLQVVKPSLHFSQPFRSFLTQSIILSLKKVVKTFIPRILFLPPWLLLLSLLC